MTAYLVLVILLGTALALALNRWPVDLVALTVLLLLVLTGLLTPEESLQGFSAPVTIIVAATYMIGAGLRRSGAGTALAALLVRLAGMDERRLVLVLTLVAGILSAFLANIAVFALMLPAVLALVERHHLHPGKLLLPLAIACNVGGLLTLLGSTPNLAASSLLAQAGYAPLKLFAFTPIALPTLLFSAAYFAFVAYRFLPAGEVRTPVRPSLAEVAHEYGLERGLHVLRVRQNSSIVGQPLYRLRLREAYGVSILEIRRNHQRISPPSPDEALMPNDVLVVEGRPGSVAQLAAQHGLEPLGRQSLERIARELPEDVVFAEVLVPPRSPLAGRTPAEVNLRSRFGIHVIALLREGKAQTIEVRSTRLRVGDSLLVEGPRSGIRRAVEEGWLITVHYLEEEPGARITWRLGAATAIVAAMIVTVGVGLWPLEIGVLLAVLLMVAAGCLKPYEMYRVVHWRTVIMIAALLPLSRAMEKSGAATMVSGLMTTLLPPTLPALVSGTFLVTLLLTQVLSNTAVTVMMMPVVISIAQAHGLPAHPLALAAVFGSSSSFLTPLTDALNVTVRDQGGYRFRDYLLASTPVIATFWVLLLLAQ